MKSYFLPIALIVAISSVQLCSSFYFSPTSTSSNQISTFSIENKLQRRSLWRENSLIQSRLYDNGKESNIPSVANPFFPVLDKATSLFPFWVLSFVLLGLEHPDTFSWFSAYVTPALALTMTCMGMSLSLKDFAGVLHAPQFIILGFLAQYIIMPLLAYMITKVAKLGPDLSAGLILVGCAPGGTASNVVTLIAKADVALSVVMTACSTLAAVVVTPYLTKLLIGSSVEIKAASLMASTLEVVLLPVLFGLSLNTLLPKVCLSLSRFTPFLSVLLIASICGSIAAANAKASLVFPTGNLFAAIIALHIGGFLFGYLFSKLLGAGERRSRTIR